MTDQEMKANMSMALTSFADELTFCSDRLSKEQIEYCEEETK